MDLVPRVITLSNSQDNASFLIIRYDGLPARCLFFFLLAIQLTVCPVYVLIDLAILNGG